MHGALFTHTNFGHAGSNPFFLPLEKAVDAVRPDLEQAVGRLDRHNENSVTA